MGILIKSKGEYRNSNAAKNTIRYITRTRKNETRGADLICWGASGASASNADHASDDFVRVKNTYNRRFGSSGGINVIHYFYRPNSEQAELLCQNPEAVRCLGNLNSREFYTEGYQCVWAAHGNRAEGLHFHFVCNSFPCRSGKGKYRATMSQTYDLTEIFDKNTKYITHAYCSQAMAC